MWSRCVAMYVEEGRSEIAYNNHLQGNGGPGSLTMPLHTMMHCWTFLRAAHKLLVIRTDGFSM